MSTTTTLAPGESTTIPSGTHDGRGIRLRRVTVPNLSTGSIVIVEHTCDGETVEALAMTAPAFEQLLAAAAGL